MHHKIKQIKKSLSRGFTLVELMIATGVFASMMVLVLGTVLSVSHANLKAQSIKTIVNNLNFSLDMMSRTVRTGIFYHCGNDLAQSTPKDCPLGDDYMSFTAGDGRAVAFCYYTDPNPANFRIKQIRRQIASDPGSLALDCADPRFIPITTDEVTVTDVKFYIIGAQNPTLQPKVTILLRGYMSFLGDTSSEFNIQTSVTQRVYDN